MLGIPVAEERRIPVHEDVSEVLEYRRKVYPENTVVLQPGRLHIVLDSPVPPYQEKRYAENELGFTSGHPRGYDVLPLPPGVSQGSALTL